METRLTLVCLALTLLCGCASTPRNARVHTVTFSEAEGISTNKLVWSPLVDLRKAGATGRLVWHQREHGREVPVMVVDLLDGTPHGEFSLFHPNGRPLWRLRLRHGALDGKCMTFFDNGTLRATAVYSNGVVVKDAEWYHLDGSRRTDEHVPRGLGKFMEIDWREL